MRPVTGKRCEKGNCKKCEVGVLDYLEALTPHSRSVPGVALRRDREAVPLIPRLQCRECPLAFRSSIR
jgi:hypothetical protein